jgi:hypothetical protein
MLVFDQTLSDILLLSAWTPQNYGQIALVGRPLQPLIQQAGGFSFIFMLFRFRFPSHPALPEPQIVAKRAVLHQQARCNPPTFGLDVCATQEPAHG